jgi:nuclear pore complex protein Nup98-Nup96
LNSKAKLDIQLSDDFKFSSFASITNVDTNVGFHEQQIWELASILFDEIHDLPQGLPPDASGPYQSRVRKDLLSNFWSKLVGPTVDSLIESAQSQEERALIYLSGGNITESCSALLSGMNFHLAQLVAQIRGDSTFRDTMSKQLKDWDDIDVVSEMNDYIRAIYHLLAGETLECRGNPQPGNENRKTSFRLSTRFNLDWKRAFGLRLWYGTLEEDDIARAVTKFAEDLDKDVELAKPIPWFIETGEDMGWSDPSPEARQDPLWGLLKLYASNMSGLTRLSDSKSVRGLFEPESLSGHPLDVRLSFQLINLLQSVGAIEKESDSSHTDTTISLVSDQLAATYATALSSEISMEPEILVIACWVLMHIADPATQMSSIRGLLDHHGDVLVMNQNICDALASPDENGLRIPISWICSSKAMYARTVMNDPVAEVRYLIEGGELSRAHDVLSQTLGPTAIIEDDYSSLHDIMTLAMETDMMRRVDWDKGAGLYFDYIRLIDLEKSEKRGTENAAQMRRLVRKLSAELEAVSGGLGEGGKTPIEKVALRIMASTVVDIGCRESVCLENELQFQTWLTCRRHLRVNAFCGCHSARVRT